MKNNNNIQRKKSSTLHLNEQIQNLILSSSTTLGEDNISSSATLGLDEISVEPIKENLCNSLELLYKQKKMIMKKRSKIENTFNLCLNKINKCKQNSNQQQLTYKLAVKVVNEFGKVLLELDTIKLNQNSFKNQDSNEIVKLTVEIDKSQLQIKSILSKIPAVFLVMDLKIKNKTEDPLQIRTQYQNQNNEEQSQEFSQYYGVIHLLHQDRNKNLKIIQNRDTQLQFFQSNSIVDVISYQQKKNTNEHEERQPHYNQTISIESQKPQVQLLNYPDIVEIEEISIESSRQAVKPSISQRKSQVVKA